MYKQTTEYKSIQKKLVTAVAMVLVACIMVVSTSYAWFTLSTAPEVTGITTSVGANGNLEMALRTGALNTIQTTIGATYPTANNSWGNLVDLSDASYMLSAVALQPARLNITLDTEKSTYSSETSYSVRSDVIRADWEAEGAVYEEDGAKIKTVSYTAYDASDTALPEGTTEGVAYYMYEITTEYKSLIQPAYKLASAPYLKTPVYDINGQPQGLDAANVINGTYNPSANGFVEAALNDIFGVRAVGTSSQLSPAEMALRAAKQTVSSTITSAKTEAATSLRVDSVELASIIINQYVSTNAEFSQADVTTIETAIANLQSIAAELKSALDAAVNAVGVAQNVAVSAISDDGNNITATGDGKTVSWEGLETLETALVRAYNVVEGMTTTLANASTGLPTGETVDWIEISAAMSSLMTTTDIRVIDSKSGKAYTVDELQALPLMTAASILMGTPTISIVDGVYADVASLTGNFSASTSMTVNVEYNGIDLKDTPVDIVMATAVAESTVEGTSGFYLPMILSQLSSVSVSGTEGEENTAQTVITDIYGYVIDLAFRTNAAGSSLLLQTDAVDRVDESYGDESLTKGHGSYMEFKSGHPDFTLQQVAALMGSVRVVFLNDEGNIFGVAALDVSDKLVPVLAESGARVVYDPAVHYFYETVDGEDVKYAMQLEKGTIVKGNDDAPYVRAELALYGFEVSDEGILTLGSKLSSDVITTLDQNIAKAVSTLVYLDGDTVENKDVAISGDSMTGSMNLQFASSAELDPMDYTFTNDKLAAPKVEFKDGKLVITNVDNAASYQITYGTVLDYKLDATDGETTEIDVSEMIGENSVPENISLMIQVVAKPAEGSPLKASNKTNVQIIYTK